MNQLETTIFLFVALCALLPVLSRRQEHGARATVIVVATMTICLAGAILWPANSIQSSKPQIATQSQLSAQGQRAENFIPRRVRQDNFASSDSCRSCHPKHYTSWHQTYHRTMTQIVSPETVLAPFENETLTNYGVEYRFFRKGDEFWVELPDPDIVRQRTLRGEKLDASAMRSVPRTECRIFMSTGSHHFQGYWVQSIQRSGFEMIQVPWMYIIEDQRWVPYDAVFIEPPHEGPRVSVWNDSCLMCHAVDGNPNGDPAGYQGMASQVVDFGISCEACHGSGEKHIRKYQNPLTRYTSHLANDAPEELIVHPGKCDAATSAQICGQCHSAFEPNNMSHWVQNGYSYVAGQTLDNSKKVYSFQNVEEDNDVPAHILKQMFWGDGAMRVSGREYPALLASPCFNHDDEARKMTCLSCHSMHDSNPKDQLANQMHGNEACFQCHENYREKLETHTHHAATSSGSLCYNCHMPYTSYGLMSAQRSHVIDNPSVNSSVEHGRPNACNQCHIDKSLTWTSNHLAKWYAIESQTIPDDQQDISASIYWLLTGDAAQRAIASWTLGWEEAQAISGSEWQAPVLLKTLQDPYAPVRYIAHKSLKKTTGFADFRYDYVASESERNDVTEKAVAAWKQQNPRSGEAVELLIQKDGKTDWNRLEGLLRQRNETPLTFPE